MEKTEFIIEIKGASVMLDGQRVLDNFSWQVKNGEHWFILGPNGAGKTTLVRMLMGYVWPLFGAEVKVMGQTYGSCDLSILRKKIAWVSPFLQTWIDSRRTAIEMVISGADATIGLFRKARETETKHAMELLSELACADIAEHSFEKLSSGEQVKTLIARALFCKPELMILDEACVHLDISSREFLLDSISRLAKKRHGPTILYITHRLEEILPGFSKGLLLKKGHVIGKGDRSEILTPSRLRDAYGLEIQLASTPDGRYWLLPPDAKAVWS
ncbi:MAG: hypothetical protein A2X49_00985 [Lentisphaerae bacterium GWF2_52_8]|nr:MAG: hypothetical protein A2X49_00985 [Lentisphaerae bacterium GWF2_52_8]